MGGGREGIGDKGGAELYGVGEEIFEEDDLVEGMEEVGYDNEVVGVWAMVGDS